MATIHAGRQYCVWTLKGDIANLGTEVPTEMRLTDSLQDCLTVCSIVFHRFLCMLSLSQLS